MNYCKHCGKKYDPTTADDGYCGYECRSKSPVFINYQYYAQTQAVKFAKFIAKDYYYKTSHDCYYHEFDWNFETPFTTEQLYEIYLKQK